jgi:hypothetical protein
MKTSFIIGLVEVESYTIAKNNICEHFLATTICFHLDIKISTYFATQ